MNFVEQLINESYEQYHGRTETKLEDIVRLCVANTAKEILDNGKIVKYRKMTMEKKCYDLISQCQEDQGD